MNFIDFRNYLLYFLPKKKKLFIIFIITFKDEIEDKVK